jgi:transposase
MSLHPRDLEPIPELTMRVAKAAFRKPSVAMMLRDELGKVYADAKFADLYPSRGRGAESAERLCLVTLLQYIEGLTDRQAALAVRGRIDWKYALGLELEDEGFDPSILSDFRGRLVGAGAERRVLELLLERAGQRGWLKEGGEQRTDSTHVLGSIRSLNRLETAVESFYAALNCLAEAAPEWLKPRLQHEWVERYGKRVEESRLPQKKAAREKYAEQLGRDGMALLEALDAPETPAHLRLLSPVLTLRRVWIEQFYFVNKKLVWRPASEQPPATVRIVSPYDVEARAAFKGTKNWEGYKVHLTETVEPDRPQLVVDVQLSLAPRGDSQDLPAIWQRLAALGLKPRVQLVDGAYISAELLRLSHQLHGIELIGPARPDSSSQAREQPRFAASAFKVDFIAKSAVCPGGKASQGWSERKSSPYGKDIVFISFAKADCQPCALREHCTRAKRGARMLQIQPQPLYEALQQARARQSSAEFQTAYNKRAGIEGTISQATRAFDLRQSRFRGQEKTELHSILSATALNVVRIFDYLHPATPRARTRTARFVSLALAG